jgi:hypothetical protein
VSIIAVISHRPPRSTPCPIHLRSCCRFQASETPWV